MNVAVKVGVWVSVGVKVGVVVAVAVAVGLAVADGVKVSVGGITPIPMVAHVPVVVVKRASTHPNVPAIAICHHCPCGSRALTANCWPADTIVMSM